MSKLKEWLDTELTAMPESKVRPPKAGPIQENEELVMILEDPYLRRMLCLLTTIEAKYLKCRLQLQKDERKHHQKNGTDHDPKTCPACKKLPVAKDLCFKAVTLKTLFSAHLSNELPEKWQDIALSTPNLEFEVREGWKIVQVTVQSPFPQDLILFVKPSSLLN